jgi:hypothetical protein
MKARDFVGLPVICRIPGPRYGERIGTVTGASHERGSVLLQMNVSVDEDFLPRDDHAFSFGESMLPTPARPEPDALERRRIFRKPVPR